jgi:hypothetical protein
LAKCSKAGNQAAQQACEADTQQQEQRHARVQDS